MACVDPMQEWTIETKIDDRPDSEKSIIVFCLSVVNGIITGEVEELTTGRPVPLSSVTGNSQPIPNIGPDPLTAMTLRFTWGAVTVELFGITFQIGGAKNFAGRFAASADLNPSGAAINGPGDGDTGTGTGTQT